MQPTFSTFFFFNYFSEKIRPGISCELSARQTIHMKCQALFSLKKKKKKKKNQNDMSSATVVTITFKVFVCVEVLWPSQSNGVMLSMVSLPNHIFAEQA